MPYNVTQSPPLSHCLGGSLSELTGSFCCWMHSSWTYSCHNVTLSTVQCPHYIPQYPEMSHCAPLSTQCHAKSHTDRLCRWFAERADRILHHKLDISMLQRPTMSHCFTMANIIDPTMSQNVTLCPTVPTLSHNVPH